MVADVDVESHSLDLVVLIPRHCLDPSVEPSESLGDGLSALMRLQSLEKMSDMLCLTPFQLRHVAWCLLAEDRCHFFEGKGDYDEGIDVSSSSSSRRNHF